MNTPRAAFCSRSVANAAAALLIVASIALVYWPGLDGFWGRDDYFQLAFARLVGSPWPLFVHDYYPVPGSVFRPLGVASMWLGAALFGTDYTAHAAADLALHAGVALALFALLLRARIPRLLALASTLLFALHPAVIGTALWWSARFDVLATLFVLLALIAAIAYREKRSRLALGACCIALVAALLAKEIGLAATVPIAWLWLRSVEEPKQRLHAWRAVALLFASAAFYFVWRWIVLGTPASGLTGDAAIANVIGKGILDWLQQMPGYLGFWPRLLTWQQIALASAALVVTIAALLALRHRRAAHMPQCGLAACGLGLFLLPAILQAPVAALNAAPLSGTMSAVEAAMQSRLYYLGIAGVAIALGVVLARIWHAARAPMRVLLLASMAVAIGVCASASRSNAAAFASRSFEISAVARAAVSAVERLELPPQRCQIALIGVAPSPEWSIYVSMDSIVKALSPDLARVAHCHIHSNVPTFFYLLGANAPNEDLAPYAPLVVDGVVVAQRRIGDALIDYRSAPSELDLSSLGAMRFLDYRAGRFEDVDAEVRAGTRHVNLR